ncbi:MAG: Gfo/Idh/MocA family oxidoreductase, partial [Clostridia bacterium]|nr:Gfo/Idh/MocA family oxidoreductase [Clostridia bacterium]
MSGDIDTVYVASPNVCHYSQALEALRAGVNVICEKPL